MRDKFSSDPRIEQLIRATPSLVSGSSEQVLQRVADLACELLEARYAAVGLLNPDKRTLLSFTTSGLSEAERERIGPLPTGHGILGLVIREGEVVRLPDLTAHYASSGFPAHHPPMRSFLGVPIVGQDGVLGDLYLTDKQRAAEFSDADVHIAVLLAVIVGAAVDNAAAHDRTRRLIEEVQELHRLRERFFAMVNHELRNSLAAAYGWAELMVRRKEPNAVPLGAAEILEATGEGVALINDLLDLSRLDEDRLKLVVRDVDCGLIARAVARRVGPLADHKQVTVVVAPTDPVVCRTDAHRVEQILMNLLTNAIRYAPVASPVTVEVQPGAHTVVFSVLDRGPGVEPDSVEQIFNLYFTTASEEGKTGHGVGLPLSRRLARLLGGDVRAISRPGQGGRFELELPMVGLPMASV
jgi:signal transduction histidine kinase